MKRCLVLAICVLTAITRIQSQEPVSSHSTAILAGIVTKEPGSQPLKKVLLHVIAEDQNQGGNYTADTDSEGRFRIEKVQPGRYRIMLEKSGFHQVNIHGHQTTGSILTVRAGQELNDLLFQMLQAGVITGKVVDEDGDPLPNFGVSLLRKRPGKSRDPELANNDRTNDLGEYRFGGLFPGEYFVAVVPPPDLRNFEHITKRSDDVANKPDQSYLTTYYPGTTDVAQATAISLRSGDEMPVNFTMVPGRTYRVRGIVTGIPSNQKPIVQFIARGVNTSFNGADVASDGQFEVHGVAPGSYSIMVFSGSEGQILSARQSVTVVAADVEGLKLTPSRPFTVSGHLRFEGSTSTPKSDLTVSLRPSPDADDHAFTITSDGWNAQVDRFGNFQWPNVTPGSYIVDVYRADGSDTFLKSVVAGNSNGDAGFSLTGPASIELVIGTRGGVIEGVVVDNNKPASNVSVVAVPEEKYQKLHERYGTGATDQNGRFTIRGLAPGGYALYAWQDLDDGLYYDAGFLKAQESNGVTLKVEEGGRQKIELKVLPVGEEWQ